MQFLCQVNSQHKLCLSLQMQMICCCPSQWGENMYLLENSLTFINIYCIGISVVKKLYPCINLFFSYATQNLRYLCYIHAEQQKELIFWLHVRKKGLMQGYNRFKCIVIYLLFFNSKNRPQHSQHPNKNVWKSISNRYEEQ